MVENASSRNPNAGIVLITTLIALILVVGLAVTVQTASLANTKLLKQAARVQAEAMDKAALRALLRPLVGEAMVHWQEADVVPLNGTPFEVAYAGQTYQIRLQDPTGLVNPYATPAALADALLPLPWDALRRRIAALPREGRGLRQLTALANGDVMEVERWLTLENVGRKVNGENLFEELRAFDEIRYRRSVTQAQPTTTLTLITKSRSLDVLQ